METEKRLIDANEVEQLFYKQVELGATDLMDAFDDALQDAQTVDAVEVVRCKDCVHKSCDNEWTDKDGKLHHFVQCVRHRFYLWHKPDDFCSYGERRTDA